MSTRRAVASLDERYELSPERVAQDRVLLSGTQALVRLTLMQKARDQRVGLNTAGFVTGYRGSPLGGLDQQFLRAKRLLEARDIRFQSGLNEDLAATSLWGSQQAELRGEGRFDGVFGIWYGKGPGVDRTGDVFRHANFAGTSKHGGVLALMGDDHTCESSTTAHQSEFHFVDVMIPILNPAGVQEILDYGLYGFALSRFAGTWVALKGLKDTIESTAVVDGRLERIGIATPQGVRLPEGGLNIRLTDTPLAQEARLQEYKRDAILAFVRANRLNRWITSGGRNPKIGIATLGKSYLDVRLALDELGIDEVRANDLGIRLFKIACPWPLAKLELMEFAHDLDLIMVVEEKRSLVEVQVREELYGTAHQPIVIGKKDEHGDWLFPIKGALEPTDIAVAIGRRLLTYVGDEDLVARVAQLEEAQRAMAQAADVAVRTPYFCSGCPHNTSTKVPEGMRAYAGIGCHYMVQWMDRATQGFTQMGGEGANWIGEAPFSKRRHVFQNLGDGTFNHSGSLAIRASLAAGVNVTYKILFNDAVAMTGGQRLDGGLTASKIARIVAAEGVSRIAVVSNEPWKYGRNEGWPDGCTLHPRSDFEEVQRELATYDGVTVLIYDQTCAAEKRRRRKRGEFPDPDVRVMINDLVCEGCGDCGVKSNCVSIQPLETEFGRKRRIDQSSCNKDFSCINAFCPSFVTVRGGKLKARPRAAGAGEALPDLPEPAPAPIQGTFNVLVCGIGGTGIVTIAQVLGMAAHLDGKACGIIDMAGLAQKGGAVFSHLRLAETPADIHAIRIGARSADLVLAGDLVVAGGRKVLAAMRPGHTRVIVNTHEMLPGDFTRNADFSLPAARLKRALATAAGPEAVQLLDASSVAEALFGTSVGANIFLVGVAFQQGAIPLSREAIERAIELNGEAVEMNVAAFRWGRRAAHDPDAIAELLKPAAPSGPRRLSASLDETVARRVEFLTAYQNAGYAARYQALVARVREAEAARVGGASRLAETVARNAFKLMAYKDEYEVARLFADGGFAARVAEQFEGRVRLDFHLAPPFLARHDAITGEPKKMTFGPWLMFVFKLLKRMKGLRGTPFDPFGWTEERRIERQLIEDYFALMDEIVERLVPETHALAVGLAAIPDKIRGYGPVKARHLSSAKAEEAVLLARLRSGAPLLREAAE
ncbi:indolepyruvate ferredoxin oxidoreductase family protein [Blastochloris tepida]|uniref:indolepyruvate ferredoxin oxidoreductase family protein n=1 Tax=Blastochloris tepida TaxID=2233851 RepID=UPI001FCE5DF6|nr:indolepyruvate ferredoxin oxidoreductase family protein [Blastochloris tepida]